jgi:phosphosulfolactate synthase (CoM biosynthesis protein A)
MAQAAIRLVNDTTRRNAATWCWGSETGTLVRFETPHKRTLEQNALMWAMLTEISEQHPHHGQQLSPDDWKELFMAELDRGGVPRMVPAISGRGFVNLDRSSSALKVPEFAQLLDNIQRFAAVNGVVFRASP